MNTILDNLTPDQVIQVVTTMISAKSSNLQELLYFFIEKNNVEVVKLLLQDARVNHSARDNYAIKLASDNGHVEIVKLLLQYGRADPSAQNNLAIKLASQNGHVLVVKLLLQDSRVDPSAQNNYAIRGASHFGHIEVVKLLIPKTDLSKISDLKIAMEVKNAEDKKSKEPLPRIIF
jgi:ankyrin repeat protein